MKVLIALTATILAFAQGEDLTQYRPNNLFVIPAKPASYNPKIVGGNEVVPHSYPHLVAVYTDGGFFCGGSIINQDVVLTAAHCVDSTRKLEIVAGLHNLKKNEPTQQRIKSTKVFVHPDWDRRSLRNDIALIKLSTSLTLNDAVQPINLDSGDCLNLDLDNSPGTVSGWGSYKTGAGISSVMREVTNSLMSNKEYKEWYTFIKDTHICLSGSGGKSSCSGDSGGALLGTRNGSIVQVGVVSFGNAGGCNIGFPSGYTVTL